MRCWRFRAWSRSSPDSPVISPHPWAWTPLAPAEQQLVGAARKALDAWLEQAVAAIRACAPERLEDFTDEQDHLLRVVDRSSKSDGPTAPDVAGTQRYAHEALDHQLEVVQNLPSANAVPETVLVPDTNALILNPAIETWNLGTGRVVVTVLPQVIAELDAKKMDRTIGDKAKSLIRRFKEFDRRGDTLVGVPVVGKIMFREVAVDASFDDAPSWLRQSNVDDRILVGALDLSQTRTRVSDRLGDPRPEHAKRGKAARTPVRRQRRTVMAEHCCGGPRPASLRHSAPSARKPVALFTMMTGANILLGGSRSRGVSRPRSGRSSLGWSCWRWRRSRRGR